MIKPLRIAIISDLHCTDNPERKRFTYLHPDTPGRPVKRHPVEALKELIKQNKLKVDLLLCPGDITDQINSGGYYAGWKYLEEIAKAFDIEDSIYATLGNHDVASREEKPDLAFALAKSLRINYPLPTEDQQSEYWGNTFCVIENDNYRLLIYNSVNDHLSNNTSHKVSISDITLEKINDRLNNTDKSKIGIAMSHHHPISHSNTSYSDTDIIDKGDRLLSMLTDHNFSIYIHGHKHEPMLRTLNNITILGAGSFSSFENIKETQSENIFHILEIHGTKGIIESWEYGPKSGWHKKNSHSSFPNLVGYGYEGTIQNLARKINDSLQNSGNDNCSLKKIKEEVNDIDYLRPDQQKTLEKELIEKFSIEIVPGISYGDKATINKILY